MNQQETGNLGENNAKKVKKTTRIQREKTSQILDAALDVFSRFGYRGATLDQIAETAGLSKPNLLYYFSGKEALHKELIAQLLVKWLEPLEKITEDGEPIDEICDYINRKLELARDFPRESRLFANEVIQGAPRIGNNLQGPLKKLVDEKAALIAAWSKAGKIADVNPHHLIFSIWSTTQHYADFDVQIRSVLDENYETCFADAAEYLAKMFRGGLAP